MKFAQRHKYLVKIFSLKFLCSKLIAKSIYQIIIKRQQKVMFPIHRASNGYGYEMNTKFGDDNNIQSASQLQNLMYYDPNSHINIGQGYNTQDFMGQNQGTLLRNYQYQHQGYLGQNEINQYKSVQQNKEYPYQEKTQFYTSNYSNLVSMPSAKYLHIYNEAVNYKRDKVQTPAETNFQIQQQMSDSIYQLIVILSCHIKVIQRQIFNQMKASIDFRHINLDRRDSLQYEKHNQKVNTIEEPQSRDNMNENKQHQNQKARIYKKRTKIDSLRDSNFKLIESSVEKGLKYLQQRSKMREKQQRNFNKNIHNNLMEQNQQSNTISDNVNIYQQSSPNPQLLQLEFIKNEPTTKIKNIHFSFNPNLQRKNSNKKSSKLLTSNTPIKLKTHSIQEQFKDLQLKLDSQSKEPHKQEAMRNNGYQNMINKPITGRQNKNLEYKLPQWLLLKLNQEPFECSNKHIFDRIEVSERKYQLNPDTFKNIQPDTHQFLHPVQYELISNQYNHRFEREPHCVSLQSRNFIQSLQTNAMPSKFEQNERNQSKTVVLRQNIIGNQFNLNKNYLVGDYQRPSFFQTHQNIQNSQQLERERRKSDFGFYGNRPKSQDQQNGYNLQEAIITPKINRVNIIQQYYTQERNKNPIKQSYDFSQHDHKVPQTGRPKSFTYSNENDSTRQCLIKSYNINSRVSINSNLESEKKYLKPKVYINYQSPNKNIPVQSPPSNKIPIKTNFLLSQGLPSELIFRKASRSAHNIFYSQPHHMKKSQPPNLNIQQKPPIIHSNNNLPQNHQIVNKIPIKRIQNQIVRPNLPIFNYIANPNQQIDSPTYQNFQPPLQFNSKQTLRHHKGIEICSPSNKPKLSYYTSQKIIYNRAVKNQPCIQLPSNPNKIKVTTSDYY